MIVSGIRNLLITLGNKLGLEKARKIHPNKCKGKERLAMPVSKGQAEVSTALQA